MPVAAHLRPTPDRVRETLFNWLQPVIEGAVCLDLFAGTGVLGFEALSRGAGRVVMLDNNRTVVDELRKQAGLLGADHAELHHADAINWLEHSNEQFDIVFIDPPFKENLWDRTCELLVNKGHLREAALLFLESGSREEVCNRRLHIKKRSQAGQVRYMLLEYHPTEEGE